MTVKRLHRILGVHGRNGQKGVKMSDCPNCGADMKHSPCCGRVDTLRAQVAQLKDQLARSESHQSRLAAEKAQLTKERNEAVAHIQLAGGYHERTPREVEIENALNETPPSERDTADQAIAELLALVDAGRNLLFALEEKLAQALTRHTKGGDAT